MLVERSYLFAVRHRARVPGDQGAPTAI